jgi:hypothetical protein
MVVSAISAHRNGPYTSGIVMDSEMDSQYLNGPDFSKR